MAVALKVSKEPAKQGRRDMYLTYKVGNSRAAIPPYIGLSEGFSRPTRQDDA